MNQTKYANLEDALSAERFSRYMEWAVNDRVRAIELYALNTKLSESFYTSMQMLEVCLRNRIHTIMTENHSEDWFKNPSILKGKHQSEQVKVAITDIEKKRKIATTGRIVAALTFSFWTAMFGKDYEILWQTTLNKIGQRSNGKGLRRKDFSTALTEIRKLRNRIAHHEPILHHKLDDVHSKIMDLASWLSPTAADWTAEHCRFREVYPADPIQLASCGKRENRKPLQKRSHS